jgi:hypothetical protein
VLPVTSTNRVPSGETSYIAPIARSGARNSGWT